MLWRADSVNNVMCQTMRRVALLRQARFARLAFWVRHSGYGILGLVFWAWYFGTGILGLAFWHWRGLAAHVKGRQPNAHKTRRTVRRERWNLCTAMSSVLHIYKIEGDAVWSAALAAGRYTGSPDDIRDGFIHFSTAAQARVTAAKYFAGRHDLVVAAIRTVDLGAALKWEASRGGDLFPHLYAPLEARHVVWTAPLSLDASGQHQFPAEMI
jgi:uncharacterized protein (DUF952 family)